MDWSDVDLSDDDDDDDENDINSLSMSESRR